MSTLAIVPVKSLAMSKSRLSSLLSLEERETLALFLLKRTIKTLRVSSHIGEVVIVSRDKEVRSIAEQQHIHFLRENGDELNQALEQATRWAIEREFPAILILPLDIPFLRTKDIDLIVVLGQKRQQIIVISPDREMVGTNALFVKPPGILSYQFGINSFHRHRQQCRERGMDIEVYKSTDISFDVDSVSDYQILLDRGISQTEVDFQKARVARYF
jgi:2-phospho-L-lactate guanylyltransferase